MNMASQVKQMLARVFRMKSGGNSGAQDGPAKPKINVTVNGKPLGLAQAATETETEKHHHYDSSGDSSEGADSDY